MSTQDAKRLDLRGLSDAERDQQVNEAVAAMAGVARLFVLRKPIYDPYGYYRPDACGYTSRLSEAWKVTEEQGRPHVTSALLPDKVIMEPLPLPPYATSADAVMPLLERDGWVALITHSKTWTHASFSPLGEEGFFASVLASPKEGFACEPDFVRRIALAACIALLRADGWEVFQ